jgi:adenylylsulfate kinase
MTREIHPVFAELLSREAKEQAFRQKAAVFWMYGLSGSGKSTLANALERRLYAEGFATHLLDGDNLRAGLNRDLGFSDADRAENIRRAAEVARLFVQAGIVVIGAFITPTHALRELARNAIGTADFWDIYIEASKEACSQRDPKGLYAKAQTGQLRQFTGLDAPFEAPASPSLVINTERQGADAATEQLYHFVRPRIAAGAVERR